MGLSDHSTFHKTCIHLALCLSVLLLDGPEPAPILEQNKMERNIRKIGMNWAGPFACLSLLFVLLDKVLTLILTSPFVLLFPKSTAHQPNVVYFDQWTHACACVRMVQNNQKHLKMSLFFLVSLTWASQVHDEKGTFHDFQNTQQPKPYHIDAK